MTQLNYSDYPLAISALKGSKHERLIKRWQENYPVIEKSIEDKEIVSTAMADVKSDANRFVDKAYEQMINAKYYWSGEYDKQHEDLKYLSNPSEVRHINSYLKKLNKVSLEAKNTPLFKDTMALTQELMGLYETMEWLKEHTVKASDKKKKEQDAKAEIEAQYQKKLTSSEDYQKVFTLLKNTATDIEQKLYQNHKDYMLSIVESYKAKVTPEVSDYSVIFEKQPMSRLVMQSLVERIDHGGYYEKNKQFKLVRNFNSLIEKESKRAAAEIVDQFVFRNTSKLAYILYTKNNLDTVELKNLSLGHGYIECDLDLKFKDSSKFIANTSIVLSYSKYDKPFYRYPTIFKNVVMPDGSLLTNASEERMDELFAPKKVDNVEIENVITQKKLKL